MVVGVSLVLERQTSEADVVQVFEPLEVRHGHTTGIDVQILQTDSRNSSGNILIWVHDGATEGNPFVFRSLAFESFSELPNVAFSWTLSVSARHGTLTR